MQPIPSCSVMRRMAAAWRSALSRLSIMQVPPMNTSGWPPPTRTEPTQTARRIRQRSVRRTHRAQPGRPTRIGLVLQRGADEVLEQRVAIEWTRFELRVKLAADEPRMLGELDDLDE